MSALYRGACGAFRPLEIESVPKLYKSIFLICGFVDSLCYLLRLGDTVRLQNTINNININININKNNGSPSTDFVNTSADQRLVVNTSISLKVLDGFVKKSHQISTNNHENNLW